MLKNTMIKYIIIIFFLIILLLLSFVKLRWRFWSAQPVFHIYDFSYYFFYNGIIAKDLPEKNRYTNFKNIETLTFGKNVKPLDKTRFVQILQRHYLQNEENRFSPKESNVLPYFEGHNSPCFISFYRVTESLQQNGEIIQIDKPIGVITSRPLNVTIRTSLKKGTIQFEAAYIDYLCVDSAWRKKGIASQLIATHNYNQCILKKNTEIALFKREGVLTGIVPLCVFNMYIFPMRKWNKPPDLLPPYSIVDCGSSNMHHFYDFIRTNLVKKNIDVQIIPEMTNLIALMKSKNIFIYLLVQQEMGVVGCYFFKKSCTQIEKDKEALICFASVNGSEPEIFIHGFKCALTQLCLNKNSSYHYIVIEEICDNDIIVANLKLKTWPQDTIPGAYFFYNYAYPTVDKKKIFIVA
jgi:ribosomal protein S18 acetylase RimI-like enzyme